MAELPVPRGYRHGLARRLEIEVHGLEKVDAAFEALKAAGLPVPHVRREKYVSSK